MQIDRGSQNYPTGPELRIMLLGKTGSGKSSVGNALLGEPEPFQASEPGSLTSSTSVCQKVTRLNRGRYLKVVDTPGTMDTNNPKQALGQICQAIAMFGESGVHAFVITLRLDVRFTQEEQRAVQMLEELFGDKFYRFAVIAYTHGDHINNNDSNFFQVVQTDRRQLPALNSLIEKCGNRITMVDNGRNRDLRLQSEQAYNLVCCIDQLQKSNAVSASAGQQPTYTNEYFVFAQVELERARPALQQAEDRDRQPDQQNAGDQLARGPDSVEERAAGRLEAQIVHRGGRECFPADATVLTPQGRMLLSEVTVGQPVHSLSRDNQRPVFSPIFMWGHRDESAWSTDFVTVTTKSARLTLSSRHLLFVSIKSDEKLEPVAARNVQPGLCLQLIDTVDGDGSPRIEPVIDVQRGVKRRGLLAPFTLTGRIAIDGIVASCYIDCLSHDASHALLVPVRALWLLAPSLAELFNRVEDSGMPTWVRLVCDRILPKLPSLGADGNHLTARVANCHS